MYQQVGAEFYRHDADIKFLTEHVLIHQRDPVGLGIDHFGIFVHQLFQAGLFPGFILCGEDLFKLAADIGQPQAFLRLIDGVLLAVYVDAGKLSENLLNTGGNASISISCHGPLCPQSIELSKQPPGISFRNSFLQSRPDIVLRVLDGVKLCSHGNVGIALYIHP